MKLNDYNTLRAAVRETAHQLAPILHRIRRTHAALEARGITGLDLLRSRVSIPEGQLGDDGKVRDAQGNVVADFSQEKYECDALLSALVGLRAAVALLTNDQPFLQRGVVGTNWWYFVEMFVDDDQLGWLE